jgi:hypothetical protein
VRASVLRFGGKLWTEYIELEYVFPDLIVAPNEELSDCEVIQLAESTGAFSFLESPEEDIYSLPASAVPQ